MPGAFICHIPAYLIGEMWIGVLIAIVVDMVPADLTTSSVAVYFFIIQIIGGNMNLLVTPISDRLGLRFALLITFPGFYIAGALIFVIPLILMRREEARVREQAKLDQLDMKETAFGNPNYENKSHPLQVKNGVHTAEVVDTPGSNTVKNGMQNTSFEPQNEEPVKVPVNENIQPLNTSNKIDINENSAKL